MAKITLKRVQVQELYDFCVKHGRGTFFVGKDHGAYVGATVGTEYGDEGVRDTLRRVIYYFRGCNPDADPDYYATTESKFGGDDFAEYLPVAELRAALDKVNMVGYEIDVTPAAIRTAFVIVAAK